MRIDKILSNLGYGSRNDMKRVIKKGHVKVNGEVITNPTIHVDEKNDLITIFDEDVNYQEFFYFMLHKPEGVISATESNQPTVLDLIHEPIRGLFPCGRLDKDTEGLLLITNDGDLTHRLLAPNHHVEKEYYVEHETPLCTQDVQEIEKGITTGANTFRGAKYEKISDHACKLTITEGKYHEIKRIFLALNNKVTYLKRLRMKNLVLDEALKPGEYRPLTQEEINNLQDGQ